MADPLHVLVVDDENNIRSLMRRMLHQMGYFDVVEEAADGEEAWEKLNKQYFDVIVCDINMPRLDGIELLKRCRASQNLRSIVFLMVTGEATEDWVAISGELGAHEYVIKPFSYDIFKRRIETIMERMRSPEEILYRSLENLKCSGELETALNAVDKWEQARGTSRARWSNLKGEILMDLGRIDEAFQYFKKTLELSPNFLPTYKNCAILHEKRGDKEKAIDALRKADAISPRDADRKLYLGKLLLQDGNTADGKEYLEQAIKQSAPVDRDAMRLSVAETYLANGLFKEAEESYVKVLKRNTSEVEIFNRLGIALRRQGKYNEAIRYYQLALRYHSRNAAIHHNLGVLYLHQQDRENAIKFLEKAVEMDPDFEKAKGTLDQLRREAAGPAAQ